MATARLKSRYLEEIRPALIEQFGYSSVMQAPKIQKVTVNMGCGDAKQDSKVLDAATDQLATITELVLLLHQESLAPAGTAWGTVEVDRILADFEDGEGALRELLDIGVEGPHDFPLEAACSRRIGG